MAQFTGQVKWFNNAKGFGFVGCGEGPDVFCHYSSILTDGYKTLKEGEQVEYDVIQGDKGPQTDKVRRVGAASASIAPPADLGVRTASEAVFADVPPEA